MFNHLYIAADSDDRWLVDSFFVCIFSALVETPHMVGLVIYVVNCLEFETSKQSVMPDAQKLC